MGGKLINEDTAAIDKKYRSHEYSIIAMIEEIIKLTKYGLLLASTEYLVQYQLHICAQLVRKRTKLKI